MAGSKYTRGGRGVPAPTLSPRREPPPPGPRVRQEATGARPAAVPLLPEPPADGVFPAIFVISAATLLLELTLTRIFDGVLWTNLASFIVSSAIFGLGLGGIAVMLRPALSHSEWPVVWAALAFAGAVLLL